MIISMIADDPDNDDVDQEGGNPRQRLRALFNRRRAEGQTAADNVTTIIIVIRINITIITCIQNSAKITTLWQFSNVLNRLVTGQKGDRHSD